MNERGRDGSEEGETPPALVEPPAPPAVATPTVGDEVRGEPPATAPSTAHPPATEPSATHPADRVEPQPAFAIDSWLEAPPGTFPGLSDVPEDDLDRTFAADRFQEYQDDVLPGEAVAPPEPAGVSPFGMPPDDAPGASGPRITPTRANILVGVCVGIIVLAALIASFAGGRAAARVDDPVTGSTARPSASASAVPRIPLALASPGVHGWDRLAGGECLQGFTGPWADTFTVVDCSQQHTAQLLLRAEFPDARSAAYPGATALQQRMAALCTAPSVVDLERAARVSDLQLSSSYAATRKQWESGDRDYFCFVSRQSGAPIDGSIAGSAQAAVWATRAPVPSPTATSKPG